MMNVDERIKKIEDSLSSNSISEDKKIELVSLIEEVNENRDKIKIHNDYLSNNFEEMSFSIPEDDLRYYKGVLVSKLKVYLGEFDEERRKREVAKLKEMAFIPISSFGLLISLIGVITCIFGVLFSIFG